MSQPRGGQRHLLTTEHFHFWMHTLVGIHRSTTRVCCCVTYLIHFESSSVTALSLFQGVTGVFAGANPSCLWARAGCSLDKSPAHRRALTDGRGRHARCQLHIRSNLGFSILLKDTSTCSSAQPGAGIWTSDLLISSRPALPAELQPHLANNSYANSINRKDWGQMVSVIVFIVSSCSQIIPTTVRSFWSSHGSYVGFCA